MRDCLIRDDLRLLTWNTARRSNRETGSYHHYSTNSLTCAWSGARTCTWGGGELDELQSGDPRRIGPYWLEGRLGSGGMGRVYLGRSPGGRQVAIKVIRPELAEDADFRARFAREVSAARKVSGIFTASVVDADLDGPVPWLATSYIAGPSLADAVATRGPLPESMVLRLAAGLAEGLSAIHAAGVVHRDLKPSNVLLADDGPRLIDFGISRSMETSALTQTGTVVGSPGFMSPEQTQGREVGPPSDIFSLGAVLTFAATGEGPFGQGSTVALLYRVVSSEPNTAGLPPGLRALAEHCLAKDPRVRPTAAQLLAGLSVPPPVAYPPPMPAHPPTELGAGPVSPLRNAPEWVPTADRPELHPSYDEQFTHTQSHWGQPAAEPESRFDRPVASPVPPWDGRAAVPVRRRPARRGWRAGLRRSRGLRGREDRARARCCADRLGRYQPGRCHVCGRCHVVGHLAFRYGDPASRCGRHGDPRLLSGPQRLRAVDRPTRDHRRPAVLGKPGERRSHPPAGHRHPPGHPERPARPLGVRAS